MEKYQDVYFQNLYQLVEILALSAGRMPGCCKRLMVILSDLKPFYNNFFDNE